MTNGHLCSISGYLDYQEHFFSHLKIGAGVSDVDPLMLTMMMTMMMTILLLMAMVMVI